MACRKALAQLARQGTIQLAPKVSPFKKKPVKKISPPVQKSLPPLAGDLKSFSPIELVLVDNSRTSRGRKWNELAAYHPLGPGPLCGSQIRYLIRSAQGDWLGLLSFSAAAWALEDRDQWIGWSPSARKKHLEKVVCNSRFLILPHVKIRHLASHVLGLVRRCLPKDWLNRYGIEPVLLETFIEAPKRGTSYQAANWKNIGQTKGRGRQDSQRKKCLKPKRIWVLPLKKDFRRRLEAEQKTQPIRNLLPAGPVQDWADEEFGRANLGDLRLTKRLVSLSRDFYSRPQANTPQACGGDRAKTKAVYRFFENPKTEIEAMLQPHYEATKKRASEYATVLVPQDTTALDYSGLKEAENFGSTGTSKNPAMGLWVHSNLVFSEEGTPLGLIDVQCWARDPAEMGKRYKRKKLPIESKESYKWIKGFEAVLEMKKACPNTKIISISDRESDVFEVLDLAHRAQSSGVHLLIRGNWNRRVKGEKKLLWDAIDDRPAAGFMIVKIPRRHNQPAREAKLEVRFFKVTLPPQRSKVSSVDLWAVEGREVDAPKSVTPVSWRILTTLPVETLEQAVEVIKTYAKRWGIEVFHRTLKSGCKIENRQLGDAEHLEACLAIDLVVAWRIFYLCKLGRETPDVPCTVFFEDIEWKALMAATTKTIPEKPPSLRDAIRSIAKMGGFLGRKGDGEPGTQTLWLGLQEFDVLVFAWRTFNEMFPERMKATVSSNRTYG